MSTHPEDTPPDELLAPVAATLAAGGDAVSALDAVPAGWARTPDGWVFLRRVASERGADLRADRCPECGGSMAGRTAGATYCRRACQVAALRSRS